MYWNTCFTLDKNYIPYTSRTIDMLLRHASDPGKIRIILLLNEDISMDQAQGLRKYAEKLHCHSVQVLFPEQLISIPFPLASEGNVFEFKSKTNFYRLLLPELLDTEDRCLYLDGDLAIRSDLSGLYETDMQDCYLAGVPDCVCHSQKQRSHVTAHNIPFGYYMNAGVLMMNLKQMRKDRIIDRMISLGAVSEFPYFDQDIINFSCEGNVKLVDKRFNVYPGDTPEVLEGLRRNIPEYAGCFKEEALSNPAIVHFVGPAKPWVDKSIPYAELWDDCGDA
mgnify:CR=1 FL=1